MHAIDCALLSVRQINETIRRVIDAAAPFPALPSTTTVPDMRHSATPQPAEPRIVSRTPSLIPPA